jgi:acetyltransferase-like isoleucine patch superfamily enzyme
MFELLKSIVKFNVFRKKHIRIRYRDICNIAYKSKIGIYSKIGRNVIIYPNVSIGEYAYINLENKLYSGIIGRFCSIGQDCIIGPENHPIDRLITHALMYKKGELGATDINLIRQNKFIQPQPPIIEDNVWIAAKCIILRGVTIGEGAIIGAGSIVTKDIPPYSVAVGSPARVIYNRKERFGISNINLKQMSTEEIIKAIENEEIM